MSQYNPLSPPRVVAVRHLGRTRRLGDTTDTSGGTLNVPGVTIVSTPLDVAAQALIDDLNARGCQQSKQTTVSNFQTQWNSAGSTPRLKVDGFYGADTASALQQWGAQDVAKGDAAQNIPAGCVGSAPSSSTSSGAPFTTGTTTPSGATSALATVQADLAVVPWWGWALAGVAGIALYVESSKKHPMRRTTRRVGRKAKRRARRMRRRLARRR